MNDAICCLFNSGRWNELNRSAFLTVKYHNPENLIFQHIPVKEKVKNPYKNKRLEEINRMRNGIIIDTLMSVDIVEIVKCGGVILEVFEGFFCHNLEYNPYTEFFTDMFEKRDLFKSQGKDLLQNLAKKTGLSVYGGNIRKDINEEYKCITMYHLHQINILSHICVIIFHQFYIIVIIFKLIAMTVEILFILLVANGIQVYIHEYIYK